jgi:hypothetical protein
MPEIGTYVNIRQARAQIDSVCLVDETISEEQVKAKSKSKKAISPVATPLPEVSNKVS